jgi:ribonuclease HI
MPWVEAILRGQKVLARTKSDGALDVSGGRVEIRYRLKDTKSYRPALGNLVISSGAAVHPDDGRLDGRTPVTKKADTAKPAARPGASDHLEAQWNAYTDGACSGNPGPAGSGMVVIAPGGRMLEGYEYLGVGTNNIAEITAILRGVEAIPTAADSVAIHTDSKYAIGVLTLGWKAKVNQELIRRTREALAGRNVRLIYVPGHAGIPMNERADELAREAVRSASSRPLPKL